jgi:hypothetical protein
VFQRFTACVFAECYVVVLVTFRWLSPNSSSPPPSPPPTVIDAAFDATQVAMCSRCDRRVVRSRYVVVSSVGRVVARYFFSMLNATNVVPSCECCVLFVPRYRKSKYRISHASSFGKLSRADVRVERDGACQHKNRRHNTIHITNNTMITQSIRSRFGSRFWTNNTSNFCVFGTNSL